MSEDLIGCIGGRYFPDPPGSLDGLPEDHLERYHLAGAQAEALGIVCDAGCGAGYGSRFFAASGAYVGLDVDAPTIEYARRHYARDRCTFECHDVTCVPWPTCLCSLVVAFEIIEHLPRASWSDFLAGCRAATGPGGLLALSCPVGPVARAIAQPAEHKYEPTESELLGLLKDWQIERVLRNGGGLRGLSRKAVDAERWTLVLLMRAV